MRPNIAVIGCGYWGKNLVRNFYELGVLKMICDPDSNLTKEFSKKYNVKSGTFEDILNNANIDAVVIASPAFFHHEMAKKCIEKDKHVYIEKPLALNLEDANELVKISQYSDKVLMVGHLLQYHPVFCKLRDLAIASYFGEVKYVSSKRLSLGKVRSEEDVIWSFSPHDISMILSLINSTAKTVSANSSSILQDDIADIAEISITFENNVKAQISSSWLHPFKEHKLILIGTKKMAIFDDTEEWKRKLKIYDYNFENKDRILNLIKKEPYYMEIEESEPLREECKYFIDVICGNKKQRTDAKEGYEVLKVLSAASESIQSNSKVKL